MNWIVSIFKMANQNWTSRIFTLVLIASLTYGFTQVFKAKKNCEDCTSFKEQNKELINALIGIKKDLSAAVTTSYVGNEDGLMYASYDTTPKRQSQFQQSQQIKRVMSKIDSILWKVHMDSLKRQTKN